MTKNSDAWSKNVKSELKNKLRRRRNVVEKSQWVENVRRDRRRTVGMDNRRKQVKRIRKEQKMRKWMDKGGKGGASAERGYPDPTQDDTHSVLSATLTK